MIIRQIKENELKQMEGFLYDALFVNEGAEPFPFDIIYKDELQVYLKNFGTESSDVCLVADNEGKLVGAVWGRIMNDYGHIDNFTPSLCISIKEGFRGLGIGTSLMEEIATIYRKMGYKRLSLSCQIANRAVGLYKKLGYRVFEDKGDEFIMELDL